MAKRSMRFQPHNVVDKKVWRTAVYVRLSDEDRNKKEVSERSRSIENQICYIKSYINLLNEEEEEVYKLELTDVYCDDDFTGMNFQRPAFLHMMQEIEKNRVDCIIVKSLSRLGRYDNKMQSYLEDIFEKQGREVRVIAITDHYDSLYDEVDMMIKFKLLMNREYSENQRRNTMAAIRSMQENGKYAAAFAPFGYKKDLENKHKLLVDPIAAEVVRRIYREFLSGISPKAIAAALTADGIPCPAAYKRQNGSNYICGRKISDREEYWSADTVKSILRKEIYTGTLVQHMRTKRKLTDSQTMMLPKEQWIRCENTHEAIISKEDWNLVQSMMTVIKRNVTKPEDVTIFKGLLKCGDCGHAMRKKWDTYTSKKTGETAKYLFYNCAAFRDFGKQVCSSHYISDKTLRNIILSDINVMIAQIKDLDGMAAKVQKSSDKGRKNSLEEEIFMKEKQITILELRLKSAKNKWLDGLLDDTEYAQLKEEIKGNMEVLKNRTDILKTLQNNAEDGLENKWVQKLISTGKLEELDRVTVLTFVDSICVYEDKHIEITYQFSDEWNVLF